MKTFINYLFVATLIFSISSCHRADGTKGTIPFKFVFSSFGGPVAGDTSCGEAPFARNRQDGGGVNILLGDFKFVSEFCVNLETLKYFGGSSTFGYFEAENGDRLNILEIKGQILPSTKEGYDLMFQDAFQFEGGTGRFKNAKGSGITDSYVILAEGKTDHGWTGTLTLK